MQNDEALNYYKMILNWRVENLPFSLVVMRNFKYWKNGIEKSVSPYLLAYVGKWGDQTRNEGHRTLWTNIYGKSDYELINLAIVRIKEEDDFVDYNLIKFVEVLNDVEFMEKDFYNKIKYGTSDEREILLIRNGFSTFLSKLLIKHYSNKVDTCFATGVIVFKSDLIELMKQNDENEMAIIELENSII